MRCEKRNSKVVCQRQTHQCCHFLFVQWLAVFGDHDRQIRLELKLQRCLHVQRSKQGCLGEAKGFLSGKTMICKLLLNSRLVVLEQASSMRHCTGYPDPGMRSSLNKSHVTCTVKSKIELEHGCLLFFFIIVILRTRLNHYKAQNFKWNWWTFL